MMGMDVMIIRSRPSALTLLFHHRPSHLLVVLDNLKLSLIQDIGCKIIQGELDLKVEQFDTVRDEL